MLANILYKSIDPRHSVWTYFLPLCSPPAGWELLGYVLAPGNREAVAAGLRNRQGELLHRYWTGQIALTALALYCVRGPGCRV